MSNTFSYEVDGDGIATVVIDLKDRSMNVATPEFLEEFGECIDKVAADEKVVGGIVTSGKSSLAIAAPVNDSARADTSVRISFLYIFSASLILIVWISDFLRPATVPPPAAKVKLRLVSVCFWYHATQTGKVRNTFFYVVEERVPA